MLQINIVIEHVNAKRMTTIGALLHWTQANSFEHVVRQRHGCPQVLQKDFFPSLEIGTKNQIF